MSHGSDNAAKPRKYERREVKDLLWALGRGAKDVIEYANAAARDVRIERYATYVAFQQKCEDFDTLSILTEYRLKNIKTGSDPELERALADIMLKTRSATLTATLHFLRLLSERDSLPLGSRDVFMRELRTLHHLRNEMKSPRYEGKLTARTLADIHIAEEILTVILERAPALLELGRAPDEET